MNFKPNPHGLNHPDFAGSDARPDEWLRPSPDEYEHMPLWNHPDYDHVGWISGKDLLHDGTRITPETVSESPAHAPHSYGFQMAPVFRRKGGAGSIAVNSYDPYHSSEIHYHPDNPDHNVIKLETAAQIGDDEDMEEDDGSGPNAYEVSLYTQDHHGNWSANHRAGRSSPAAIKDALLAVHLHHDELPIEINRITGMARAKRGHGSKRRMLPLADYAKLMKSFTSEELERYFNEVFG